VRCREPIRRRLNEAGLGHRDYNHDGRRHRHYSGLITIDRSADQSEVAQMAGWRS
jgi:hypothetical protein